MRALRIAVLASFIPLAACGKKPTPNEYCLDLSKKYMACIDEIKTNMKATRSLAFDCPDASAEESSEVARVLAVEQMEDVRNRVESWHSTFSNYVRFLHKHDGETAGDYVGRVTGYSFDLMTMCPIPKK